MRDRRGLRARILHLAWLLTLAVAGQPAAAEAFKTSARAAILVDVTTDQILYEKAADEALPPASMSKLMTVYMIFERLKYGGLSLEDTLPVSKKAWRKGGTKMFVELGGRISIDNLLHGIITQSGNDACIVVAEGLAGSEEAFAEQMTRRAREIGLTQSVFKNANGLPAKGHVMSVRDLATLAHILVEEFPEYYHYFGAREFQYGAIKQYSRNKLLGKVPGVDGLKTGYTDDAGYGITASAKRGDRRLIAVLAGLRSAKERAREGERLLEYGFQNFGLFHVVERGQTVEQVAVWQGDRPSVPLVASESLVLTLSHEARRDLAVKLVYDAPLPAPVPAGSVVGHLDVTAPGLEPRAVPLVVGADVGTVSLFGRMSNAFGYFFGPS